MNDSDRTFLNRRIVDEQCSCGHMRSEHADNWVRGHGRCRCCTRCIKFTWTRFVYNDEILGQEEN